MDNKEMLEAVTQFLGAYWYDGEKDDVSIVDDFVTRNPPGVVAKTIDSVRQFIDSPDPAEVKSDFIRNVVWLYFPENVDAPIKWLQKILSLLEELSARKNQRETN